MFFVIIQTLDGSSQWNVPYDSWAVSDVLNGDRTASVSFNRQTLDQVAQTYGITSKFIIAGGFRELIIKKNDDVLYTGYISEPSFGGGTSTAGNISISSKGFFSLLSRRFSPAFLFYTNQDLSDIAWSLISYTQSLEYGDFGITRGLNPSTRQAQRTFRYKTIQEAIEDMSNMNTRNGIDFDIDELKRFNVYYPEKGSVRKEITLEYGHNIDSYSIIYKFIDQIANEVIVFGEGFGDSMIVETVEAEEEYKQNFFLLQSGLSEKDTGTSDNLILKGEQYLKENKYPRPIVTVNFEYKNPDYTAFDVGDRIKLIIEQEEINQLYRVKSKSLNYQMQATVVLEIE